MTKSTMRICLSTYSGKCTELTKCPYNHDRAEICKRHGLCAFFLNGYCSRGLSCPAVHEGAETRLKALIKDTHHTPESIGDSGSVSTIELDEIPSTVKPAPVDLHVFVNLQTTDGNEVVFLACHGIHEVVKRLEDTDGISVHVTCGALTRKVVDFTTKARIECVHRVDAFIDMLRASVDAVRAELSEARAHASYAHSLRRHSSARDADANLWSTINTSVDVACQSHKWNANNVTARHAVPTRTRRQKVLILTSNCTVPTRTEDFSVRQRLYRPGIPAYNTCVVPLPAAFGVHGSGHDTAEIEHCLMNLSREVPAFQVVSLRDVATIVMAFQRDKRVGSVLRTTAFPCLTGAGEAAAVDAEKETRTWLLGKALDDIIFGGA